MVDQGVLIGGFEEVEIRILDYDSHWPRQFLRHQAVVLAALGDAAVRIEHIGSTSVPGLAAKPIIDMLLVVQDSADEAVYLPALQGAGYELRVREPEFHEHRMLRTPRRDAHIHVYSRDCPEIDRYLAFRDRLRACRDELELYAQTKRALANQDWPDMNAYAEAKSGVVEQIIERAGVGS